jgi:hypothetical protein
MQFYDGPLADEDPMWDVVFRWVYNTPGLRSTPWYIIHGSK